MRLIVFFIGIAIAAVAFFVTMHFTGQKETTQQVIVEPKIIEKDVPTVDVIVARDDLPVGTVLKQSDIDLQPWPAHLKLDDFIVSDAKEGAPKLEGMVTRTPFKAKEPIVMNRLANPNDPSFLAASLPKSMRAVTIQLDPISGVGGFVYPGDRVDVILTHDIPKRQLSEKEKTMPNPQQITEPVSEVLIADVRVLAVNQMATSSTEEKPGLPTNASVEVSKEDAQKIRLAERNGTLSLSLRSLHDKDDVSMAQPTAIPDLSRITPPSYYPVLYDHKSEYTPKVVDVFGNNQASEEEADEAAKTAQEGVDMQMSGAGVTNDITIIRGIEKETVGVTRP